MIERESHNLTQLVDIVGEACNAVWVKREDPEEPIAVIRFGERFLVGGFEIELDLGKMADMVICDNDIMGNDPKLRPFVEKLISHGTEFVVGIARTRFEKDNPSHFVLWTIEPCQVV